MVKTSYFANTLTLTISTFTSTLVGTSLAVGILGGVEITGEFEHHELYGQETVFREDVRRSKAKVAVKAKFSKFHPRIIGYILGTERPGIDINGGSSASVTQASITDSSAVPLFHVRGTVTGKNGESYKCRIESVYFETAPWPAPEDDFMGPELTGYGSVGYLEYVTT